MKIKVSMDQNLEDDFDKEKTRVNLCSINGEQLLSPSPRVRKHEMDLHVMIFILNIILYIHNVNKWLEPTSYEKSSSFL